MNLQTEECSIWAVTIMRSAFLAYLILVWSSRTCDLLIMSAQSKIPYFSLRTYDKNDEYEFSTFPHPDLSV